LDPEVLNAVGHETTCYEPTGRLFDVPLVVEIAGVLTFFYGGSHDVRGAMLKFVTTKPPRGRSSSGTPDREIAHRPSRETSPSSTALRSHQSPRGVRKHHSFSHPHQYAEPKSTTPASAPYRTSPHLSRSQSTRESADLHRTYQAPPEFRTGFGAPSPHQYSQQQQQPTSSQFAQQQQQPYSQFVQQPQQPYSQFVQQQPVARSQPLQQQFRQQLQPSVFSSTKYSYQQQEPPADSAPRYATLYFPERSLSAPEVTERKFPLEVKGLYDTQKEQPQVTVTDLKPTADKLGGHYPSGPSSVSRGEEQRQASQRKQAVNLGYSDSTAPRSYTYQGVTFNLQTQQKSAPVQERSQQWLPADHFAPIESYPRSPPSSRSQDLYQPSDLVIGGHTWMNRSTGQQVGQHATKPTAHA
ncbi:hypothetical protein Btru_047639, partial [Bulinus truncatus]